MNTHKFTTQAHESGSVSNASSEKNSDFKFSFEDDRVEAVAQRKLQDAVNNSPRMTQLTAIQNRSNDMHKAHTLQRAEEHYRHVPGEAECINKNFVPHMSFSEKKPGDNSADRGASDHTIIYMTVSQLQNEIALYLNDLPEGTELGERIWITTQMKYVYIHYYDGAEQDRGNDVINFRAQLRADGYYEAYHFGQVGAWQ